MGLRGPKKGAKYAPTISKEAAREALREIVMQHMETMTAAQVASASGIKYLVARKKLGGQFVEVTESQVKDILAGKNDELTMLEVWEKQPSTPAFTDLMNRALDKPKEQEQEVRLTGEADLLALLLEGRARVAGK